MVAQLDRIEDCCKEEGRCDAEIACYVDDGAKYPDEQWDCGRHFGPE